MLFTNTISLVLALAPAALFAAPTSNLVPGSRLAPRMIDQLDTVGSLCDLSDAKLPQAAQAGLPAPGDGLKLRHIAIGRGTQNYTCATSAASETPKAVGAVASLFNATCDGVRAPAVLASVTKIALEFSVPGSPIAERRLSGHHEFTEKGVPLFKLQTDKVNFGYVQAKVDKKCDAPKDSSLGSNGLGSVPWLKLVQVEGDYKEVYRIHTAGGVAPKTCEGIAGNFDVQYAAEYWFYA